MLQSVLVLFAPQIRKAHIDVEQRFEEVAPVRGFPGELRQVFSNLVGNALDAMQPNCSGKLILHVPQIQFGVQSRDVRGVRVTVVDAGAGIPSGVRKKTFLLPSSPPARVKRVPDWAFG